jgi:two-component system, chemotaxis family, protein-glutamate methylesterase/glutaminase
MEKDSVITPCKMLIIGGSAGGLDAVLEIIPKLKTTIPFTIVLVLHRKNTTELTLTELIASKTKLNVREVEDKEVILQSTVYIAPGDYHLLIEKTGYFSLDFSEKIKFSRPSIDVTFESAAMVYGPALTCIVLSGANNDGTEGAKVVKKKGGTIIVQHPETALSPIMPESVISSAQPHLVLNIRELIEYINGL